MANLEKIKQLESELQVQEIDALLILSREDSDPVLSLFLPVHVVAQSAIFFCRSGKHVVITGSTDANMYNEFGVFEIITPKESFEIELKQTFERLALKSVALNISETDYLVDGLTVGQYQLLQDAIGEDVLSKLECSSESLVTKLRSIKTDYEVQCIKTAIDKTCAIYAKVATQIRVGMSETDIGELFVEGMREQGVVNAFGAPYSYPLICINRCGLAHREPNAKNLLQLHDILICDFSVNYKGYCSDIARSFYVLGPGETTAPADVLHGFETTVAAVSEVIDQIKP
ncbi:MAG: M24 family metallopeptidase, partial [Sphaerochaetaceae bacterium]